MLSTHSFTASFKPFATKCCGPLSSISALKSPVTSTGSFPANSKIAWRQRNSNVFNLFRAKSNGRDHVPKENNHEADIFFLHSKWSCLSIYLRLSHAFTMVFAPWYLVSSSQTWLLLLATHQWVLKCQKCRWLRVSSSFAQVIYLTLNPKGKKINMSTLLTFPTDVFSQVFPYAFLLFPPTKSKLFRVDTPNHVPCLVPQWPVASKSREPVLKILKRRGFTMIPQK